MVDITCMDIKMMDIRPSDLGLLVSLSVLLEEKNVTRAASRMGLSQPAMSAQLARLRDLFKDPLLVPSHTGKGMVVTARASGIEDSLRAALQSLHGVICSSLTFDPKMSDQAFCIGSDDSIMAVLTNSLIPVLSQICPKIRLTFRNLGVRQLTEQLGENEIDLALVDEAAIPKPPLFRHQNLLCGTFKMAQRTGHPRGNHPLTIEEYAELQHVVILSGITGGFSGFIDTALSGLGLSRKVVMVIQELSIVPLILEKSDFICTVPSYLVEPFFSRLSLFDVPFETRPLRLSMVWHMRSDGDPGHQWLREQISRSVCPNG